MWRDSLPLIRIKPACTAGEALSFLHRWLSAHPSYKGAAAAAGPPPDSSQALSHAVRLFEGVVASSPGDAELQLALGVLHHLDRRYQAAIAAFQRALELRPGDYRCVQVQEQGELGSRCHALLYVGGLVNDGQLRHARPTSRCVLRATDVAGCRDEVLCCYKENMQHVMCVCVTALWL